jgi:tetratricopeptide (TPR) repeat protein
MRQNKQLFVFLIGFLGCFPWTSCFGQTEKIQKALNVLNHTSQYNPISFHKAVESFKKPSQSDINALLLIAYDERQNGNIRDFLIHVKRIENSSQEIRYPALKHLSHLVFSDYYDLLGKKSQAKFYSSLAIEFAKKNHKNRWVSQAYRAMASVYMSQYNSDSTFFYIDKSLQFAKRSDSELELAFCFDQAAMGYAQFSKLEEAVTQELLALQVTEKIKNNYYQALYNRNISDFSLLAKNLREAENYLRKSNVKLKNILSPRMNAENEISNARILVEQGMATEALRFLPSSIKKLERMKDIRALGKGWLVLGQVYNQLGRTQDALKSFENSLTYFGLSRALDPSAEVYNEIGNVYYRVRDLESAETNILKSMKIRYEIKEKIRIFDSYLVLANIYEKRNQKQRAYDYLKMYNDFLRKNSTSIDSKMIEDLTQTNSREERERLIETQGEKLQKELKEKEILQLQSDRQLLGIGIVISIFFLSALVVFFVIRQRNTLQEQKESEMAQTLLRSQMNPHFIFNALAVIQSYIYENTPEKTSKFLVNFSRLIRLILENSPKEFITIDTEKEILSKYLTTQKLRFEERFNFNLLIDEDLIFRRAMIPPMITQPFIENAIEHGQLHTIEEGMIQIEMNEREGMLEIIITDNGVGRTQSAKIKKNKSHKSMAIDITRQRIEILNKKYKGKGSLAIEDLVQSDRTGTKVIICLPIIYEKTIFGNDEKGTHN